VSLEWSENDVKKDPFVISGECEKCGAKHVVVMQMFEKSSLKRGARADIGIQIIERCSDCMVCVSASGTFFTCDETARAPKYVGKRIRDPRKTPPKWCPLQKVA
jgi:hypothetical protein